MADLTYSASLQDGISPGLKRIQSELKNTQDIFSKFQNALGALAIGGFVTSAYKMAAALDEVAIASGLAIDTVLGFGQAVAANGGSVEGANQAIGRFSQFINNAAEGNRSAQETFQKLGVSLDDLRTLSEQDLMKKTVKGLADTNDNALRTAKSVEIFGKSFATVDFKGVNDGLDGFIQRAGPTAAAIKAAADAEGNFAQAINSFQVSLLSALEPISKFAAALDPQKIEIFIDTLVSLGVALGSLFVFNKLTGVFATFTNELSKNGSVIKSLTGSLNGLTGGSVASAQKGVRQLKIEWMELGNIFNNTGKGVEAASGPLSKIMSLFGGIGMAIGRMLPLIGQVVSAFLVLDGVIKLISGKGITTLLDEAGAKMASLLGISYKTAEAKREEEAAAKAAADAQQKQTDAAKNNKDVVDTIGIAYKALVADLQKGVAAYMDTNAAVVERLRLDGELIGLTEQQRAVKQALFDVESKNQTELTRLQELYAQKSQSSKQEDLRLLPDIQKAMESVRGSLEGQKKAVEELIVANAARVEQENQLKALADYTSSIQLSNAKALRDLQHEMATSTMSAVEKKYADIARAADESARAEIAKENSRRKQLGLIQMTTDEEAKYYSASKKGLAELQTATKKHFEQSRTWSAGWNKAWREYADDATNAAKSAENIFRKTTQGIEDAIVNAAKTGKFEWKGMLSDIAEEILRSGIRKSITGLFEGLGSGSDSLLGKVGKMFGLDGLFGGSAGGSGQGTSSNNPLYTYVTNGGAMGGGFGGGGGGGGGGTSSSGGGWWDTVTDTVSTVWDGITGAASSVWDTVTSGVSDIFGGGGGGWLSDIASGISSIFGGWFANGGTLGAGKWGIAGENGPEMISGPATITPMGGSSMVTYNINAVDAASFKAMIAADPGFIHAVAQQGGRNVARRY